MPVARRDVNLARIAAREHHDPMLDILIRLGELIGLGFPVTIIANGHCIEGHVAPPEVWARLSDDVLDSALDKWKKESSYDWTPEEWDEVLAACKGAFTGYLERRKQRSEREREEWEDVGSQELETLIKLGGELPREVAQKVAQMGGARPAVTLTNAVIETPAGTRYKVDTIRVVTANVSAWWIGRSEGSDN
jgi:hypothetical protein